MAENLLSDSRLRTATRDVDGVYLPDGGGLRFRLTEPSSKHPRGARLAEYHFKLKRPDSTYLSTSIHLGTIGDAFVDAGGKARAFTLKDARQARDAARELVGKGIDPREARRLAEADAAEEQRRRLAEIDGRRTVRQAFEQWHTLYLASHRKDGGDFVLSLFNRHVLPAIGNKPLAELQRRDVAAVLDVITALGIRRTANMTLALLRQFVGWCAARDWIERDPTLALSKSSVGGKDKPRQRVLSTTEIVKLREALPGSGLPKRLQHAVWVLLATGCRVGELSSAALADVDLEAKTWLIPETKNGNEHVVHLSDFAIEHFQAMFKLAGGSAFLLPGRTRDDQEDRPLDTKALTKLIGDRQREKPLKGRTKKASAALLLARGKWTPHDLRRTMATRMRQDLRVSTDVVERCLNHTPQGIVGVYQTGELMAERQQAFEAWGLELERIMTMSADNVVELVQVAA